QLLIVFLLLIFVAGVLRFYKLGDWSFGFDELFTTLETKILFGETTVPNEYLRNGTVQPENTQYYRLPHLLPAAYAVHQLDYQLFGEDEFGSRMLMAILGTLSVAVIFLLAQPLIGFSGSFILALLILLLPEHILHSQCNRFYILSFLLISVVILLGAYVAVNRSQTAAFWLGPFAVLLILSNTFGGIIWGGVLAAVPINFLCAEKQGNVLFSVKTRNIALWLLLWSIVLLGIFVFHITPLTASWNANSSWGYTPLHAAMAFVQSLGWHLLLFSILGTALTLVNIRKDGNAYWFILVLVSGLAVWVLPLKIVYQPLYGFLFIFPFLVTATIFIRKIYQLLLTLSIPFRSVLAVMWVAAAILLNFPTLYSYYQDGNRPDYRAAFQYVAEHWEDGDRLTGFMMGTAQYYIPNNTPHIPLSIENTAEKLQTILDTETGGNGRLWIVLHSGRGGFDQDLRRWLSRNAVFETSFNKKRFDPVENNLEVFLVSKTNTVRK
ncbi:MAG: hypothetical protein LBC20_14720, partial [Planctomycetaceae bacterium]|nr:hypothetical protein [Planctomycetaceae bacterium]